MINNITYRGKKWKYVPKFMVMYEYEYYDNMCTLDYSIIEYDPIEVANCL